MDNEKLERMVKSLGTASAKELRDTIMESAKGTILEGQLMLTEQLQYTCSAMIRCNVIAYDIFEHYTEINHRIINEFAERAIELVHSWREGDLDHANELMKTIMYEVRTRCTEVCKEYQNRV